MNDRARQEGVRELTRALKAYSMLLPIHAQQLKEMEQHGKITPETQAKAREAAMLARQIDPMIDKYFK